MPSSCSNGAFFLQFAPSSLQAFNLDALVSGAPVGAPVGACASTTDGSGPQSSTSAAARAKEAPQPRAAKPVGKEVAQPAAVPERSQKDAPVGTGLGVFFSIFLMFALAHLSLSQVCLRVSVQKVHRPTNRRRKAVQKLQKLLTRKGPRKENQKPTKRITTTMDPRQKRRERKMTIPQVRMTLKMM